MANTNKCERCQEELVDMGICFPPITKDHGMHPACIAEALKENPEVVAGRIPAAMIGTPELLDMLETIAINPQAGEPVDPNEGGYLA